MPFQILDTLLIDIIKGFLIGMCAAAPFGPVAIRVLQKTLGEGRRTGFLTALGGTFTDTLWSIVAIFGLAVADNFIGRNQTMILLVGGFIVACVGVAMTFKDPFRKLEPDETPSWSMKDFIQTALMGLSNPGGILVIFTLFAFFKVNVPHDFRVAPVILAVSFGSAAYWYGFTMLFSVFRKKVKLSNLIWISRICGIAVMIIGLALLSEGLMKTIFA